MYIGQKLMLVPTIYGGFGNELRDPHPCRVVYINEAHRYYVVEFDYFGRKFREAFHMAPPKAPEPEADSRGFHRAHGPVFGRMRPRW